jgi:putative peptide zinc metalloprotease protein
VNQNLSIEPNTSTLRLADGVELVGEYKGSGLKEPLYLAKRADGQVVQLSALLFTLLHQVDGCTDIERLAERTSQATQLPVSVENVAYLLQHKIKPTGLIDGIELSPVETPEQHHDATSVFDLRLRFTLLHERAVQFIAPKLEFLFAPVLVALFVATIVALDCSIVVTGKSAVTTMRQVADNPALFLAALTIAIASMVFHEFGHAAACAYGGARPGRIGGGLYIVWPAFFTNVTDSYRLTRSGRLRVDLGGVYFNVIFAVALGAIYLGTHSGVALVAILLVHTELLSQLAPTFRFDGHLVLADVAGVPDLFDRIGPVIRSFFHRSSENPKVTELKPSARLIITAWVLVTVPIMAIEMVAICLYGPRIARTFFDSIQGHVRDFLTYSNHSHYGQAALEMLMTALAAIPVVGFIIIIATVARQIFLALWILLMRRLSRQVKPA